jgi:hypothetical protein
MASANLKFKSGNKIDIMLDGAIVGGAQSIDEHSDYGLEPGSGIGDIHVTEYVPSMARHTVNLSNMVLKATGRLAAATVNGDGALQGLVFDIIISEKDGGMLRKLTNCSYASGTIEVRKHAIVSASATFNALDASGSGA